MLSLTLLMSAAFALTACGGNKKTAAAANGLNEEQRTLSAWLATSKIPQPTWSAEELDAFEAKVNRLEQVERDQARLVAKSPGYRLEGPGSARSIALARYLLKRARSNGELGKDVPDGFNARRGRSGRAQKVNLTDDQSEVQPELGVEDDGQLRVSPEFDPDAEQLDGASV